MDEIVQDLLRCGLIDSSEVSCEPLTGGVSSDIFLVTDGRRRMVVKRALPQLKVADQWRADVSRNRFERKYLAYVASFLPDAVPKVIHENDRLDFFVMEYLGGEWVNWKSQLLAGVFAPETAERAGQILGSTHRHSFGDPRIAEQFAADPNFHQLRVDPYLLTTAARHPRLTAVFQREAERLTGTHLALMHGDFSPKNILTHGERLVLLDCEVACFGDPAFDAAFLVNHLFLKALHLHPQKIELAEMLTAFWSAYQRSYDRENSDDLEMRTCNLLLMLMLARVDGKSPVEYLGGEKQDIARTFVYCTLPKEIAVLRALCHQWTEFLDDHRATSP